MTARHRADRRKGDRHAERPLMGLRFGENRPRLEAVTRALGLFTKHGNLDERRVVQMAVSDYLDREDIAELCKPSVTEDGSSPLKGELK